MGLITSIATKFSKGPISVAQAQSLVAAAKTDGVVSERERAELKHVLTQHADQFTPASRATLETFLAQSAPAAKPAATHPEKRETSVDWSAMGTKAPDKAPEFAFPRSAGAFAARVVLSHGNVELSGSPDQAALKSRFPTYDGQARFFAMVPEQTPTGLTWTKQFLTSQAGQLRLTARVGDNDAAVLANGVAFGAETNVGKIWFQGLNDNCRAERP